ncbi:MAG: hypothetical protein OXC62_15475 [Aestuariivita sp.]|nr:hypothetical protein [Aestuariivita sp.]
MRTLLYITRVMVACCLTIVSGMAFSQDESPELGSASTVSAETAPLETVAVTESGILLRTALSEEIDRLTSDIEDMRRLMRWQEDLMRAARVDRAEALRQRRPHSECLESVLAPICDDLSGLFLPPDTTPIENENKE